MDRQSPVSEQEIMSVVVTPHPPIESLEWFDPLQLAPPVGRSYLSRSSRPVLTICSGGEALSVLLDPVPLKSFKAVRGMWVKTASGVVAFAAGNPPSVEELKMIGREVRRLGLV